MCVSKGETTAEAGYQRDPGSPRELLEGSWGLAVDRVICLHVCLCACAYQQLERDCSLGGSYVWVLAAGETGIQGQTGRAQLREGSTGYLCMCIHRYTYIYMYTHRHIYSQRREQDDAFGAVCVCVSDQCVASCVYNSVYICALCTCAYWEYVPSLTTGRARRHGAALVALPLSAYQI